MDTKTRVVSLFKQKFGYTCAGVTRAPGRVNLLGEHVDYNGGWVFPAAIDRATYVAFSATDENQSILWAADYDQQALFSPQTLISDCQRDQPQLLDWARYPAGVAWALLEKGLVPNSIHAVFASDVPRGAGLSSSASVELAFATAWNTLGKWKLPPMELALLCQRAENAYVGVNCGIMDQAASACGELDRVLCLDCRSLEYQALPLPERAVIIIADTSVRHALSASAYNKRRASCEEAVRILREDLPGITALRDVRVVDFNPLAARLPPEVQKRARHVVEEIERTREAPGLLQGGAIVAFGRLMNACHASLRDLYEVSCPELDAMAHIAQTLKGCYGARLTGGGFGGCTVNLVEREQAGSFIESLASGYELETGLHAEIYVCRASAGAGPA
jgi:galactokinase